jgi:hypothetical protein
MAEPIAVSILSGAIPLFLATNRVRLNLCLIVMIALSIPVTFLIVMAEHAVWDCSCHGQAVGDKVNFEHLSILFSMLCGLTLGALIKAIRIGYYHFITAAIGGLYFSCLLTQAYAG